VASWRRSISSCRAWTDQRTHARPASSGGVQARATISTRCRGGKSPRATAARAIGEAGQPFSGEAPAPALHPVAAPMEVGGNGHVAPPHGQEGHVGAVGQPAFGRAGATEVFKGGALFGGQRDDHDRWRSVSTGTDRCVHRRYDLCCDVCGDDFEAENTCPWTELLLLPQNLGNGALGSHHRGSQPVDGSVCAGGYVSGAGSCPCQGTVEPP